MRKRRCLLKKYLNFRLKCNLPKVLLMMTVVVKMMMEENDEDLKLEDLDSDSVADLQDEFGASNNGGDDYDDMIPVMNRSQNNLLLTFYFSLFHLQIIKLLSWESRARRQLIRRSTASLSSSSPRATAPSA